MEGSAMQEAKVKSPEDRKVLDRLLEERWLSGLWNVQAEERPLDPKTTVKPHIWKWKDVYDGLLLAREAIGIKSGTVERRNIRLVNPGLQDRKLTTHTMLFGFQLIQPGEVAPAHRHTMTAIRFVLKGKGAYTNVEGKKMIMEAGDLILTPQWTWHEHANGSAKDEAILFSMHDTPVLQAFGLYREEGQGDSHIGL